MTLSINNAYFNRQKVVSVGFNREFWEYYKTYFLKAHLVTVVRQIYLFFYFARVLSPSGEKHA